MGRNHEDLTSLGRELSLDISQSNMFRGMFGDTGFILKTRSIDDLADEISNGDGECLSLHGFDQAQKVNGYHIDTLCRALELNKSIVDVKMNWICQDPMIERLLETFAAMPRLRRLSLRTFTWISEKAFLSIFSNKSLKELEFQGIWIRTALGVRQTVVQTLMRASSIQCDLTKLRLIRCCLRDEDCANLRQFSLSCSDLNELSVRGNRWITGVGLASLVCAKVTRLDLAECAVSSKDLLPIVHTEGSFYPRELILAQNGRISIPDSPSFLQFAEFCVTRLKLLDLSECRIRDQDLLSILGLLQNDGCRLESLLCGGGFSIPVGEIAKTLAKNQTLLSIVLRTSRDEYVSHLEQRIDLVESLKSNYNLHSLEIGCHGSGIAWFEEEAKAATDSTRKEIDFLLRLNRAGRKVLLEDGLAGNPAVLLEILKKTFTQGDDVLYWFLKNGLSTHFVSNCQNSTYQKL